MSRFFLFRKSFWLTLLKIFVLVFIASMVAIQIPELSYDLGSKEPVRISSSAQLDPQQLGDKAFASVEGTPDFERAFIYQRYGLQYTYFVVEPYGMRMVVRSFEKVTDEWEGMTRFLGKVVPFDDQPFSYRIEEYFQERFQETVPEDAYFLSLYDTPRVNGWQLGAVIVAVGMWALMFYLFFFFRLPDPEKYYRSAAGAEYNETKESKEKVLDKT